MNRKMVFYTCGRLMQVTAALLLLPAVTALIYGEYGPMNSFIAVAAAAFLLGTLISKLMRSGNTVIYAREGFAVVGLAWLLMSAIGALPFVLTGDIPNYIDAFFETVSGFTTTGSSILTNVEALSKSALLWRSFTHWVGGMGVLVFVMAIMSNVSDRSIHIMRAEMPGPAVGKLLPRVRDTAKVLYLIYIVITAAEVILLRLGGMSLYESLLHSFGTAGTGGLALRADSIAGYSPYCQTVIAVFMMLFGINFNLYYLILIGRARSALKSTELWVYLGIITTATAVITVNISALYPSFGEALRHAYFQVSSITTTTGYSTADFNLWPGLSKAVLFALMFLGGCAGSTAGGLKMSRAILLCKLSLREIKKLLHPRSVTTVNFEGKEVDDRTLSGVATYFGAYVFVIMATFLLVSFEPFGFESNFTAAVACFNNIGPGFAAVGPMGGFAGYTVFSKLVFSAAMLLGRLEIFPLLIAVSPSVWRGRGRN